MTSVSIDQILIGSNRRAIKEHKISELMESIKVNGLLNPITLDQNMRLIAGLHRLTACKLLGLESIECNIINYDDPYYARLAEIDENLIRSELDALERAELWEERDRLLAELGLRARSGDNQFTRAGGETVSPPAKTTLELANEAGYTKRTFQQGKQIARDIAPEVKKAIKGTDIAKSPRILLNIARAGGPDRKRAEQAEKAVLEAKSNQRLDEAALQENIAAEARANQKELQLEALRRATAERAAKINSKQVALSDQQQLSNTAGASELLKLQIGDKWLLNRHLVYCGDTTSREFRKCLPSHAALAIASTPHAWNHNYLIDEAVVVAVLCSPGAIHDFCIQQRMPFRDEFILGNFYTALFSHQPISKSDRSVDSSSIEGVEGIISHLVSRYSNQGNFVITPNLGHGEVLIACERMRRICFAGEETPELARKAISRWQQWTEQQAEKISG